MNYLSDYKCHLVSHLVILYNKNHVLVVIVVSKYHCPEQAQWKAVFLKSIHTPMALYDNLCKLMH